MSSPEDHATTVSSNCASHTTLPASLSEAEQSGAHSETQGNIVDLANRRFGSNGWSSAIRSLEVDFVDVHQSTGQVSIGLSAVVRLVLKDGTYHDGIGYGSVDNCQNKEMAFEQAKKRAITDALDGALGYSGDMPNNQETCLQSTSTFSQHGKGAIKATLSAGDGTAKPHICSSNSPERTTGTDEFGSDQLKASEQLAERI